MLNSAFLVDMNLSKVRSKVLRAVGQDEEFVEHYQEVLDYIDIEISVEEEAKIGMYTQP